MPLAYWCVLIAALMPLVLVGFAKYGVKSENRVPREDYEIMPPANRRAYAAHLNAYENFPFFAVAVIVSLTMGASVSSVNLLAVLYVVLRILYGFFYIKNYASLRSIIYPLALLVNIAIFVLPAFQ